jgi:iron(III) transport system substrate-binding protein
MVRAISGLTIMLVLVGAQGALAQNSDQGGRFAEAERAFQNTLAAAKKEGELTISAVTSNTVPASRVEAFSKLTGIKTNVVVLSAPQSFARLSAERASGKLSMDVRMSGFDHETYALRDLGHAASFGDLPNVLDPGIKWTTGLKLMAPGEMTLIYRLTGWSMVVNRDIIPDKDAPKSWKDLADPKYKGKIIWYDPRVDGIGCTSFFGLVDIYGKEWGDNFLRNIAVVTRVPYQYDRQVARGEFGIGGPTIASSMGQLMSIPEPRPVYLLHPSDGIIVNASAVTLLKDAPHPNAAKLWANFLLSREGQQTEADMFGGGPIRADVTPAEPEYALSLRDKPLPGFPVGEEYTRQKDCAGAMPAIVKAAGVSWSQ